MDSIQIEYITKEVPMNKAVANLAQHFKDQLND